MVAETLLKFYAVAISNCNVVHVHAEHKATYVVSVSNGCCYTCPDSNFLLCFLALPIANDNLAWNTHTAANVTEFYITVSTLVEVHEVHVHSIPRYFGIILCMEVQHWLVETLQTLYPHLCR